MPDSAAAPSSLSHSQFEILGPVAASVNGTPARLGGRRQVIVLARLLVTPGRVVSLDQLADAVWDGDLPAHPEVTLRSYVSNLRRVLEPDRVRRAGHSCIESQAPGYRIVVDPELVDAQRFERLVAEARSALAGAGRDAPDDDGPPREALTRALESAMSALDLWRGDPLTGMGDAEVIESARARLVELRLVAIEVGAEARLRLGDHEPVIADLNTALVADPLRERLTELLMLALYRAGRQSEALAVYARLRSRLIEGLGIDPGRRVRALEHRILIHDPTLVDPEGALTLPPQATDPTLGTRTGPTIGAARLDPTAGALPGRHLERRALGLLLDHLETGQAASALIVGEPGSGKSALVADLVTQAVGRGATPVWSRCWEVARHQVLWPWGQVIDGLLAEVPDLDQTGLDRLAAIASLVVARSHPGAHAPQTTADAAACFQPAVELLRRAALRAPLVLVMEDVHWADEASIELLSYAGAALANQPVGFVVTGWTTERPVANRRGILRRLPRLVRVDLEGLAVEAVETLAVAAHPDAGPLAAEIHQQTAGNPGLVTEALAGLVVDTRSGALTWSLTSGLRDAVLERVERIHPRALEALAGGAVEAGEVEAGEVPPRLTVGSLAGGVGDDLALASEILAASVMAGVLHAVDRDGGYWFVHPVAARVVVAEGSSNRSPIGPQPDPGIIETSGAGQPPRPSGLAGPDGQRQSSDREPAPVTFRRRW